MIFWHKTTSYLHKHLKGWSVFILMYNLLTWLRLCVKCYQITLQFRYNTYIHSTHILHTKNEELFWWVMNVLLMNTHRYLLSSIFHLRQLRIMFLYFLHLLCYYNGITFSYFFGTELFVIKVTLVFITVPMYWAEQATTTTCKTYIFLLKRKTLVISQRSSWTPES